MEIYDTTLRDGSQMKGISFSVMDKLKIVEKLDDFGIPFIEGGWPGSNPKDVEFFEKVSSLELRNSEIAAFTMTCRKGREPEKDLNMKTVLNSKAEVVTIVGKTWLVHVEDVLKLSPEENLHLIEKSCRFFRSHGRRVFYDAEHFFEGYKEKSQYALKTLQAAINGGAERVILCDTNGGTLPWEVGKVVREIKVDVPLGIHAHNDGGLALANSLEAVKSGASQVQGTINGYGERSGNADLCSIIPTLQLKMGIECVSPEKIPQLTEVSHFVSEIANLSSYSSQPYVGSNAFVHKGGMHVDAMGKNNKTYHHIDPSLIGGISKVVVSELSGKSNILSKAEDLGINLSSGEAKKVLHQVKVMESRGFQFEDAEASVELLMRREKKGYEAPFEVLDFTVSEGYSKKHEIFSQAVIKFLIKGEKVHTVSEGDGPVNALDLAARKALHPVYPNLETVHLIDYKVRILNEGADTEAGVRVLITFASDGKTWNTVGSSTDIIKASWRALSDGLEYAILNNIS